MKQVFSYRRKQTIKPGMICDSSDIVGVYAQDKLSDLLVEQFWIVLLNTKNRIIGEVMVSQGSLTSSIVSMREVFLPAIVNSAAHIICIHNHPSGDPAPGREDIAVTKDLKDTGNLLGIRVLDHIIVGDGRFYSFATEGLL